MARGDYLFEELKQANQHLLEVEDQIPSLQSNYNKVVEDKKKIAIATSNLLQLGDELAQYKDG